MNPTFPAFQKAMLQASINIMMGIPHKSKKDSLPTEGQLFARSDMVVAAEEAEAEEKERKTRAHLDQLAEEARERAAEHNIPIIDRIGI